MEPYREDEDVTDLTSARPSTITVETTNDEGAPIKVVFHNVVFDPRHSDFLHIVEKRDEAEIRSYLPKSVPPYRPNYRLRVQARLEPEVSEGLPRIYTVTVPVPASLPTQRPSDWCDPEDWS